MIWGEEGWGIYSGGCLARAERTGRTDGRTWRNACTERTGGRADVRSGGRADERTGRKGRGRSGGRRAERVRTVERTGGRGPRGADTRTGGRGADGAQEARTGDSRRRRADEADGSVGGGRADGVRRSGGLAAVRAGGLADERVGLGLKGHIPRGPLHSWAPSPLASSERERAGCLGVQWGPARLHVKHPYLAPGLACLV